MRMIEFNADVLFDMVAQVLGAEAAEEFWRMYDIASAAEKRGQAAGFDEGWDKGFDEGTAQGYNDGYIDRMDEEEQSDDAPMCGLSAEEVQEYLDEAAAYDRLRENSRSASAVEVDTWEQYRR